MKVGLLRSGNVRVPKQKTEQHSCQRVRPAGASRGLQPERSRPSSLSHPPQSLATVAAIKPLRRRAGCLGEHFVTTSTVAEKNLEITPTLIALAPGKRGGLGVVIGTANAYTGPTFVDEGTLLVDGVITGAGDVQVASSATLGGTGSLAGTVTVFTGGTITGGTIGTTGTLTVGGLEFDGGTYHGDLQGSKSDTIATSGPVDLQASAQGVFDLNASNQSNDKRRASDQKKRDDAN